MIALVIMAMVATLVTPSWRVNRPDADEVDQIVRRGRELAARRGETLVLTVDGGGAWRVMSTAHDESAELLAGTISKFNKPAFSLELTALGACLPRTQLPQSLAGWDVGRCAVDSLAESSR